MTTTEPFTPPAAYPTVGDIIEEEIPLVGLIPVAGPPILLLAGPLVLFALLLAGPFALLVTLVVVLVAAAAVVGLVAAIVVSPFLLLRHLRGHRLSMPAPAARLAAASRGRMHFNEQLEGTS